MGYGPRCPDGIWNRPKGHHDERLVRNWALMPALPEIQQANHYNHYNKQAITTITTPNRKSIQTTSRPSDPR
jgi:hypothetical protein